MPDTQRWASLTVIVGFVLIVLATVWFFIEKSIHHNLPAVATVDFVAGDVVVKRKFTREEFSPKVKEKIFDLDQIKTSEASSVILSTITGDQVKIEENSVATIESATKSGKTGITVFEGAVQLIKDSGAVTVTQTLDNWRNAQITTVIQKGEVKEEPSKKSRPHQPEPEINTGPISDVNLKKILEGQKTFFNRCFAKHLVSHPDAQGEIITGFLLLPRGRITNVKVLSSNFNDSDLEKCITSVIERSPFKSFAGEPISVTYPIRFE